MLKLTWSPPDRGQSGNVELLQAYAAPRGEEAFECEVTPGVYRGYCSRVLLDALREALPDVTGYVTGEGFRKQVIDIWGRTYKAITGDSPPIILPSGAEDIRLCARAAAPSVVFSLTSPAPTGSQVTEIKGAGPVIATLHLIQQASVTLPPGLSRNRGKKSVRFP